MHMKILPFTIPKPKKDALIFQEDRQSVLYQHLHQHKEIQISYIKKGEGALLVGDSVRSFKEGDIIVLGSNLPHVFRSAKNSEPHMFTIFFTENCFGTNFFQTEELTALDSFFRKAESGFKISPASEQTIASMLKFPKALKLDRFILFFQLLQTLNIESSTSLSTFKVVKIYSDLEGKRLSAVFDYTIQNFKEKITLDAIAKEAAMTPNAFCKYFKKRTRKTYVTYLNELRIEEACRLLLKGTELSIPEIAEECGFQNLSHFNRKFKSIKKSSPIQFKKEFAV